MNLYTEVKICSLTYKWLWKFILKRSFKNHVDNRGWVGGLKFAIFVHVYYIKNVHGGRWVVKKEQNYVHVVIE